MKTLLLLDSLGFSARYPLYLFALRLAAQVSSALLLIFGFFLAALNPGWPIIVFAVLLLAFGMTNLAALYRIKTAQAPSSAKSLRYWAEICNVLLPLAYCIAALSIALGDGLTFSKLMAVALPAALNALAIEQSWQFHFPKRSATDR